MYFPKQLFGIALALALSSGVAHAATLIDNTTQGFYNSGIGTALNGTNPAVDDNLVNTFLFPNNNSSPNDPTFANLTEPDLSAASGALGSWLTTPATPGGSWTGLQNIPGNWAVNSETAIIYELDGGVSGLSNVIASLGVDNGIFVWLNGTFVGGGMAPGGAVPNEYSLNLGNLAAGQNFLQILREDHGGGTGYDILVTGDVNVIPLPAAGWLMIAAFGGFAVLRRRPAT
ncbi:MAG: VPLPA-CTERM sorting domain-containing protein [Pseudomonadota bacterium]